MAKLLRPILLLVLVTMGMFMLCPNAGLCEVDPLDCGAEDDDSLIVAAPVTNATVCFPGDRQALLRFKAAISRDPKHALATWSAKQPNCCSWNGVTCDGITGRIVSLNLGGLSLKGRFSSSLGSLSSLQILELYENFFTGSLPPSLGNLSNLIKLCLDSSTSPSGGFSGPIPESFGGLTSLQMLDVSYNSLSGSLPSSIGNMKSLIHLRITNNKIGGPIPASFARLSNLNNADLGLNKFSGRIPDFFNTAGGLGNLAFLYLENNRITGLPDDLSNLKNLQWVVLQNNPIGSLGNVAGLLTAPQLVQVDLSNCGLSGSGLEAWLARGFPRADTERLSDDVTPSISLANNALTGSIPSNIGTILPDYFQGLDLSNNRFSGQIPSSISKLTSLGVLELDRNKLEGSIPSTFSSLTSLARFNVSYNHLSGKIPQIAPFTTFDVSTYKGNAGLCGTPLPACRT